MIGPLKPIYCIQRDADTIVPLIAVDELPEDVKLKGVPLKMSLLEGFQGKFQLVGDQPAHGLRYELEQPISTETSGSERGDESGSDGSHNAGGSESSTQKGDMASRKRGGKSADNKALVRVNPLSIQLILLQKGAY